jgi:hypothetical protein
VTAIFLPSPSHPFHKILGAAFVPRNRQNFCCRFRSFKLSWFNSFSLMRKICGNFSAIGKLQKATRPSDLAAAILAATIILSRRRSEASPRLEQAVGFDSGQGLSLP